MTVRMSRIEPSLAMHNTRSDPTETPKTHEGELAMTTVPGVAPVLWGFTVWDNRVADELSRVMGKRVILHYKEYRYLPTTCFGETTYFVDRVEVQEE